jgi:hypothetical protein
MRLFTRHVHPFEIPIPPSTLSEQLNADKALLRKRVLELRQQGMSYRQIGAVLGLHWTRVGQIARMQGNHGETG